jgi:hypothetical protein
MSRGLLLIMMFKCVCPGPDAIGETTGRLVNANTLILYILNNVCKREEDVTTSDKPPLVVDLDGTLTPTDTLVECVVKLLKQSLTNLFRLTLWLPKGKAPFKGLVAANCSIVTVHPPSKFSQRIDSRSLISDEAIRPC